MRTGDALGTTFATVIPQEDTPDERCLDPPVTDEAMGAGRAFGHRRLARARRARSASRAAWRLDRSSSAPAPVDCWRSSLRKVAAACCCSTSPGDRRHALHVFSQLSAAGAAAARGIVDTPQEHYDDLQRISRGTIDP